MRRRASPARRRLRRIRWSMTLAFALVILAGLVAMAVTTLRLDDDARQRDARGDVVRSATALARAVDVQRDGDLDLTRLERRVEADPPKRWGVLSDGLLLDAGPDQAALPTDAELDRIVARTRVGGGPAVFEAPDTAGTAVLWSAEAVLPQPGADPAPGSIVLVGEVLPRAAQHADLARALAIAVAALTLVAATAGHLLSGRAMRPAVTGLDRQERFLTEAAHELRTPLTTLRLLLDVDAPGADDRAAERRQADRLERLLESLLLRARATASGAAPALEPLRLDQLVERVAAEQGSARLHLEPTVVRGAPAVLAFAVRNLIENAERHGGGAPEVGLADGVLVVADQGPGIPAASRRVLLRGGVSEDGGTGSGLALVAWAAEVHGARLELGDTPGGGLTVRLAFPTSSPPHDRARRVEA